MAKNAAKPNATTQNFIEIQDIVDDIVVLKNGTACLVIEIQAVNFALLSRDEQNARIYAYASLLNSLSFAIQIVIRNKRVDITNYLHLLDSEMQKAQNPKLATYIGEYRNFITELIKVNTVLDKKFYIVVPYSSMEKTAGAAAPTQKGASSKDIFAAQAKQTLHTKAQSLLGQLARLNLRAKTLSKEELTKLYFDIFNRDLAQAEIPIGIQAPVVTGQQ